MFTGMELPREGDKDSERRYSPAGCTGAQKTRIEGKPDRAHVSTSYVERQNLTMRMPVWSLR